MAPQLLAQLGDLQVEHADLVARLLGQRALVLRLALGARRLVEQIGNTDVALRDDGLGKRGALRFARQPRRELLGAVARGRQFLIARLHQLGSPRHLRFELVAHLAQRVDVALEAHQLGKLNLDRLPVGGDGPLRLLEAVFEFRADLTQRGDILAQAREFGELQLDRLLVGGDQLLGFGKVDRGSIGAPRHLRHVGAQPVDPQGELVPRPRRILERCRNLSDAEPELGVCLALEREQLGQLADLAVETGERLVAPGQRLA